MIFGRAGLDDVGEDIAHAVTAALTLHRGAAITSTMPRRSWIAGGSGSTLATERPPSVAIYGWIDNAPEIARELACPAEDPAAVYAAALEAWDHRADSRLSGCYAAIALLPDGSLHCARSPWEAPPIHYHVTQCQAVASSLLRCLFAAGVPRAIDRERLIDELAIDRRPGDHSGWQRDTWRVPLGGFVRLAPGKREETIWHRPPSPLPDRSYREEEAVEEVMRLLDEAGGGAMGWARKPALALSGGLDSTLVGTSLLRALPPDRSLTAITWVPDRDWSGSCPPGTFGDESALAGEFAATDPRIDWHVTGRDAGSIDRNAREIYTAAQCFAPGLANTGPHHDVFATARRLGCDAVLFADYGNATFSEAGEAAYREYPRQGHWRQWAGLISARPNDPRPLWRKISGLTVLPALPSRLRKSLRGWVHPARKDMAALYSPLSARAWTEQRALAAERGSEADWADWTYDRDREAAVERVWRMADGVHHDINLAFEQLYGIRRRDVTAYRPLIEFCLSLPTRAFAWDGRERRLARRMGAGRLPPSIHANLLHGQHNPDWHERLTRDLGRLRELVSSAADHPLLGDILDTPRLLSLLDNWPGQSGWGWDTDRARMMSLTRALMAIRFVGAMEARNDM